MGEEWNWNIYLDDLKVTATREKTVGVPLPADLIGAGTRPLLTSAKLKLGRTKISLRFFHSGF